MTEHLIFEKSCVFSRMAMGDLFEKYFFPGMVVEDASVKYASKFNMIYSTFGGKRSCIFLGPDEHKAMKHHGPVRDQIELQNHWNIKQASNTIMIDIYKPSIQTKTIFKKSFNTIFHEVFP